MAASRRSARPVALLAGATGGLGPAIARRLAREGFDLSLVSRRRLGEARALAGELARSGARSIAFAGDLGDPRFAARAVRETAARLGRVDALVLALGDLWLGSTARTPPEALRAQLESNVVAPWTLARAALPRLARSRRARIVFFGLAGAGGPVARRRIAAHAAAKLALLGFARSLAVELAPRGIAVLVVAPGVVATRRSRREAVEPFLRSIPGGKANDPEDVAAAVAYCLGPEAAALTGAEIPVANGFGL